jgi:small subunit ribosomal protein S11
MGKKKVTTQAGDEAVKDGAASGAAAPKAAGPVSKKKRVEQGKVYINASYNNTVVTVTDVQGNVVAWASSGSLGFSGPKKATPFASQKIIAALTEKTASTGPRNIQIIVKGIGSGRDSAIRSLINQGFEISSIKDVTPIPFNGPKAVKTRRV